MRCSTSILFVALVAVLFCSVARASLMRPSRDWSIAAPGGRYGFIETEFVTLQGEHVQWETSVACGPLHVALPCRAPGAILVVATASVIAVSITIIVSSRIRKHGRKCSQAA